MNISDEAVEAAAKAMWGRVRVDPWEGATDHLAVEVFRADARLALEAAAPHLMAQAWDAGFDRGFYDPLSGSDRDASESAARNPYRATGAGE